MTERKSPSWRLAGRGFPKCRFSENRLRYGFATYQTFPIP